VQSPPRPNATRAAPFKLRLGGGGFHRTKPSAGGIVIGKDARGGSLPLIARSATSACTSRCGSADCYEDSPSKWKHSGEHVMRVGAA